MNYPESVAYIESLAPTLLNPSLDRFSSFMAENGRGQDKLATIHIGGTNGKGSTTAIVDSVLRCSGLKVGRFTGPHLLRWNERFHVGGVPINDETFAEYATRLRALSEDFGRRHPEFGALTWFEFLTAIAFFYFADQDVDVGVFEVGLGGRWDATNVLTSPLVSAIITVDLDHTHILGETVGEIAREKAGIIKANVPVVTACDGDALAQIKMRAEQVGAPVYICEPPDMVKGPQPVAIPGFKQACGELALAGSHQALNALVATAILSLAQARLKTRPLDYLAAGFKQVYWPGRLQCIPSMNLILDGAHNVAGAQALRYSLDQLYPRQPRAFILSFFQNKNVEGAVKALVRPGDFIFAAEAKTTRTIWPAERIVAEAKQLGATACACPSIAAALRAALKTGRLNIATGSFATIKESMQEMGWRTVEDGRTISVTAVGWRGPVSDYA